MYRSTIALILASSLAVLEARKLAQTTTPSCPLDAVSFCAGNSGLFANACDSTCASYLNCGSGHGALQSCAPGLRFNPKSTVSSAL